MNNNANKLEEFNLNIQPLNELQLGNSNRDSNIKCEINEYNAEPSVPDGGYGWVVVAASFMVMFVLFGNIYSYGQIIDFYNTKDETFKDKKSTLLYISTVNIAFLDMGTLITGRLDDRFGHRVCILIGGIVYGSAFLLSSWATEVWHLIITQGALVGISGSILCIATISAPLQWFDKRRGLASGISAAGCGLGGLVLSPLVTFLLEKYGAPIIMRVLGGTYFTIIIGAGIVIKDQTKPIKSEVPWHDCTILKNSGFLLLLAGNTITSFGYLIPLLIIQDFARECGLSSKDSSYIVGVINGVSAVSRIICGLLADKFGVLNLLISCLIIMFISCCAIWPVSTNFTSLIVFGMIFGISLGGFGCLPPIVSAKLFGVRGLSTTNGWIYFFAGFPCLVGAPIAYKIINSTPDLYNHNTSKYLLAIQYTGITALVGAIILMILKFKVAPKLLAKV